MRKVAPYFFLLIILVLFVWHKIYFHSILGEGFVYFDDQMSFPIIGANGSLENIFRYDNFARLLYSIFEQLFRDNLRLYMALLLFILSLMTVSYFLMVKEMTKNKKIALLTSLFFAINYITMSEMVATGYYQWVTQRVPNFIFSFIAFLFLVKFLESKRGHKYYLLSLVFFSLSILAAHYSIFFLPMFIFYTLFYSLFKEDVRKKLLIRIIQLAPFVLIAYFLLTRKPVLPPDENSLLPLLRSKSLLNEILDQITIVTVPFNLWFVLQKITGLSLRVLISILEIPVVLFYLISSFYLLKRKKIYGVILFSCLFSMIAVSFLNLYLHRSAVVNQQIDSNRYFFPLGFFIAMYWAIILWLAFIKKHRVIQLIIAFFVLSWIYKNTLAIWERDKDNQHNHLVNKNTQLYVKKVSVKLDETSLVILPKEVGPHAASFYQKFYGKKQTRFISITEIDKKQIVDFDPQKDFLLDYDYEKNMVINKTDEYSIIFSNL